MDKIKKQFNQAYLKLTSWINPLVGFRMYAVVLLLVMLVSHKLLINNLGFYYDDWEGVLLQKQQFSFSQIWEYFLVDRPFSALIHYLIAPIIGTKPIAWHLLGLGINWLAIIFIEKTLLRIWPHKLLEIGWIGLLLGVYPGITRQFVVRTSMPHYISFLFFSLSMWLMVKAVQETKNRWINLPISLFLALMQMLLIEYFSGLELIRPLILYYLFKQEDNSTGKACLKALRKWVPYLAIFLLFILFRLTLLPQIQQASMTVKNVPWILRASLQSFFSLFMQQIQIILQDLDYAVLYVWSQTIIPADIDIRAKTTLLAWFIGFLLAGLTLVFMELWHRKKSDTNNETVPYPGLILLICLAAMLLGGLPVWAIGRQVIVGMWSSRFLFGIVIGAVSFIVIVFSWMFGKKGYSGLNMILAIFLLMSISYQIRIAKSYALTWGYEKDYYWQLKWRAPALETGTFILSPYTPFLYNADYQLAYAINVLYAPGNNSEEMKYWWFDGPDDIIDYTTDTYPAQREIDHQFRSLSFKSNMEQALPVIYKPTRGCLQVLDSVYEAEPLLLPEERSLFSTIKPGLILNKEIPVPTDIFGKEPAPNWCYYFQHAELARSEKKWEEILTYWNEAQNKNQKPKYGPEYLPFMEASAQQNEWEQAYTILEKAYRTTEKMEPFLCFNWERISANTETSPEKESANEAVEKLLNCSQKMSTGINPNRS